MVVEGRLDWHGVADRMSVRPARIARIADQGRPIEVGEAATLVVVDPTGTWRVDADLSASRSANTPFAGREFPGRVLHTILRGRPTVIDGVLT